MADLSIQLYSGPNLRAPWPALMVSLSGADIDAWRPDARFIEQLLERLPELTSVAAGEFSPDAFVAALDSEPALDLATVATHVAAVLQRSAGCDVGDYRVVREGDVWRMLLRYRDPEFGRSTWNTALALLVDLTPIERSSGTGAADPVELRKRHAKQAAHLQLDQTAVSLRIEAEARGIPCYRLGRAARFLQYGQGAAQRILFETVTPGTTSIANKVSQDKAVSASLLHQCGIPVPRNVLVTRPQAAQRMLRQFRGPVVVKPNHGMKGQAVSVGVQDERAMAAAFERARRADMLGQVVIETLISGDDHRLLVVDGRVVAVARRLPARVRGDGVHTVRELVEIENRDPRRGEGFAKHRQTIRLGDEAAALLQNQRVSVGDIPTEGRWVRLGRTANIATGGTSEDVTDLTHPAVREVIEEAVAISGLDICGVDLITTDITLPLAETGGAICEINACPGLRVHEGADGDPLPDVRGPIIEMLFPDAADGRIPTVAVTGSGGKTTTCFMLAAIHRTRGFRTGIASTTGQFLDDRLLHRGGMQAVEPVLALMHDPRVEVAVIETGHGSLERDGFALDACDVSIVTNVGDDHVGVGEIRTKERIVEIKSLLTRVARHAVVLNADDDGSYGMLEGCSAPVCLFGTDPDNERIREHLATGGRAVVIREDGDVRMMELRHGADATPIIEMGAIPATYGGAAVHNEQNALAAAAAGWCSGADATQIAAALGAFEGRFDQVPGRLNVYRDHPFLIVLDYAHHKDSVAMMKPALEAIHEGGERLCVITTPGNRPPHHFTDFTAELAPFFGRYFLYTAEDRRGRDAGVVQGLLRDGLIAAGVDADRITLITDLEAATAAAFDTAASGDLVYIISDRVHDSWAQITGWRADP